MPITSTVRQVTPADAQKFLDSMVKNRVPTEAAVASYASAMSRGEWKVNGEAIVLDEDEKMIDGQHRCLAIVRHGKPVDMLVVRGVKRAAFDTIDIGRKRTSGDVLGIVGYTYGRFLAAALTFAWRWENGQVQGNNSGGKSSLTPHQIAILAKRFPDMVEHVDACQSQKASLSWMRRGHVSFFRWATFRVNKAKAEAFWNSVESGENLSYGSPAFAFRERMIAEAGKIGRSPAPYLLALGIRAWNAHYRGEKMTRVQQRASDPFPPIAGFSPIGTEIR